MRRAGIIAALMFGLAHAGTHAVAQPAGERGDMPSRNLPVLLKADMLRYDRELGIVIAKGNVEFAQNDRILLADAVTYNQRTETVTASGNVTLVEPSGDVMFADYAEFSGDLKDGIIEGIRIRLADNARIVAAGGRRVGGTRTEMRKAVYSPCKLCEKDPSRPPIWRVKAARAVHDKLRREIQYTDAVLEFYGVPIAYTPFLSHPDPTVKRKTGFLVPSYGSDTELGTLLHVPYYFDISPTQDATVTPIFTSNEGPVLTTEYRNRFVGGLFEGEGSVTQASTETDPKSLRGHFDGTIRSDFNDTWRGGIDLSFTSDDTYKRRYGFGSKNTLVSRMFVEGFRGRNYASANAYRFQGLRASDDSGTTPIVLPWLEFNFTSEPDSRGALWSIDADALALTRTRGTDIRRGSVKTGWRLPYTSRLGEVYTLFATLQTDGYLVDEVQDPGGSSRSLSGLSGRIFPQVGLDWRMPFVRRDGRISQLVEPIAGLIAAPNGGNPDKVPNEDSLNFELDDTNIFEPSRFTGRDRVEGGQRVYYGLKMGVYGSQGGFSSAFIGQTYRLRDDSTFSKGSGLEGNLSDVIGRVDISTGGIFNALYRFRLNEANFIPKRNEVAATFGPPALNVRATYLFIDQQGTSTKFPNREEITTAIRSRITKTWSVGASTRKNLITNATVRHGFNLQYNDECFTFSVNFTRKFTQDRDVRPTETLLFRIVFKTLGEVRPAIRRE